MTIGCNYVYRAKPDGLVALMSGGAPQLNQIVGMKAVAYDFLKMPAVIAASTSGVFYMRAGIIERPEDLPKAKRLVFGYSGGTGSYLFVCAKEMMDIPTEKVVLAYSGTAEARRAFFSGEVNFSFETTLAYLDTLGPYVAKGEIMPLFQAGILDEKGNLSKDGAFSPTIPTIEELYRKIYGKSPSGMAWEAYKGLSAAGNNYNKVLFLPPGTPDNIVRIYWDAFGALVKDPDFRKAADLNAGPGARWIAGESCDREYKQNFGMKAEVVQWFRDALPKYGLSIE